MPQDREGKKGALVGRAPGEVFCASTSEALKDAVESSGLAFATWPKMREMANICSHLRKSKEGAGGRRGGG